MAINFSLLLGLLVDLLLLKELASLLLRDRCEMMRKCHLRLNLLRSNVYILTIICLSLYSSLNHLSNKIPSHHNDEIIGVLLDQLENQILIILQDSGALGIVIIGQPLIFLDPMEGGQLNRQNRNANNAINADLQQQLNEPVGQPMPLHFDLDAALSDSAISGRDKELLTEKMQWIQAVPDNLPVLTQMEEILISPVHALTQVWQIYGGQYAYRGHICNFPRDSAILHKRVPLLPEECEIIIFRRAGTTNGEQVNEDFQVRRGVLETWLKYLELNHPTFRDQRVRIDWDRVNSFGHNENVQDRIQNVSVENMPPAQAEGPPQFAADNPPEGTFSAGFAPNVQPRETEFEQIQRAGQPLPPELNPDLPPQDQILTMPAVRGTPNLRDWRPPNWLLMHFQLCFPPVKLTSMLSEGKKYLWKIGQHI
ncbi:hypothetical protein B0H12DRAFT_1081599 [Mycena haematopus]|nr:hypothetical protein B0H12DRAFT_1081599 [Mycena haematopus]